MIPEGRRSVSECRSVGCSSTKGKSLQHLVELTHEYQKNTETIVESSGHNIWHNHILIHEDIYAVDVNINYGQNVIFNEKWSR